jgi:hypothetical protein
LWLGVGFLQPLYVPVAWLIMAGDIGLRLVVEARGFKTSAASVGIVNAPAAGLGQRLAASVRALAWPEQRARLTTAVAAGLLSAPMLLYTIFVFSSDPVLALWNAQNRLPSPHPLHYVAGYVVWVVPAVVGWRVLWQRQQRLALFTAAWLLLAPVLLYLPIPTQRRLIEGVQLPLAVLAVLGLGAVAQGRRRWAATVMLALVLPTSLLLWLGAVFAASRPSEPIFLPAAQVAVFDWLAQQAQPGQVALAAYHTGNALPAYTPLTTYIGHGPETIGLEVKQPRVTRFFAAGTSDAERRALLAEGRISYVLFGPHERALGGFDPDSVDYLEWGYAAGDYTVYRVVPAE